MRCVAAPVFNPLGELVTAVSVTGTTAQISADSFDKLGATVKEGGRENFESFEGVVKAGVRFGC